jgi:hypothetical protein
LGRLTLNVLLSFAQFEREVIGERVRDKIAASKRKGIWVGGPVPLGYRSVNKKLEIVPEEADLVRKIFAEYLRLGSVSVLAALLEKEGIQPKPRSLAGGRTISPQRFMVVSPTSSGTASISARSQLLRRSPRAKGSSKGMFAFSRRSLTSRQESSKPSLMAARLQI